MMSERILLQSLFFFVAAAAYSQLFCGLLGKYLLVSKLGNAHIIRQMIFDYNFQWLNLAWQFESCVAVHTVLENGDFLKTYFTR